MKTTVAPIYSKNTILNAAISAACESTQPRTKERNKALAAVKWKMGDYTGHYVAMDANGLFLTENAGDAQVYDGRDNEEMKLRFAQVLLRTPLQIIPV